MTSCGKRKGAGRPVGSTKPGGRSIVFPVRLNDEERDKAKLIGNGNASAGLRLALAKYNIKI